MKLGGAMFFTEYSMTAPELAVALEERGYDSFWAPEHSHIPLSRKTPFPGGGQSPISAWSGSSNARFPATCSLQTTSLN